MQCLMLYQYEIRLINIEFNFMIIFLRILVDDYKDFQVNTELEQGPKIRFASCKVKSLFKPLQRRDLANFA